jgi:uncharacterized protein YndB with AHSA1/START domain
MTITVETFVKANIDKVWNAWNNPDDIKQWNAASDDWHTTYSEVDLKIGGKFLARMEAKNGSFGFDFSGTYQNIEDHRHIEYVLEDGRNVSIKFESSDDEVKITETFDEDKDNPIEMQQAGWQAILNNFAKHVESKT